MTDFYKRYCELCAAKGKSASGVASAIGLSNAAASGWKNGKIPSDVTLAKLSDYFGVPVSVLLDSIPASTYLSAAIRSTYDPQNPFKTEEILDNIFNSKEPQKKPATENGDELDDVTREIMEILAELSPEELALAAARIRKIKESR